MCCLRGKKRGPLSPGNRQSGQLYPKSSVFTPVYIKSSFLELNQAVQMVFKTEVINAFHWILGFVFPVLILIKLGTKPGMLKFQGQFLTLR